MEARNQIRKMVVDGVTVYYTEVEEMNIVTMSWYSLTEDIIHQTFFHGTLSDNFPRGADLREIITKYKRMKDPLVGYNLIMDAEIANWVLEAAPEHSIINIVCGNGVTTIELGSSAEAEEAYESLLSSLDRTYRDYMDIVLEGELIKLHSLSSNVKQMRTLQDLREKLEMALDNLDRIEIASANAWLGWFACVLDKELELTTEEFLKLKEEGEALLDSAEYC